MVAGEELWGWAEVGMSLVLQEADRECSFIFHFAKLFATKSEEYSKKCQPNQSVEADFSDKSKKRKQMA